jgi:hypothetical protein
MTVTPILILDKALAGQRHFAAKRNPKRQRVDVTIDISSLTLRVMKKRNFKTHSSGDDRNLHILCQRNDLRLPSRSRMALSS